MFPLHDMHFTLSFQACGWVSTLLVQQLRYEELLDNFLFTHIVTQLTSAY